MPVVSLTVDSSKAVKGLKGYDKAAKSSAKETNALSGKLKTIKGNFALMAAAATAAAAALGGAFAIAAIKAASNLEETQGKFDVVFRGMSEQAEGWAKVLQSSYGLSEEAGKRYLSSVQDLLVPTGLARDKAAEMSNAFVKLARDLGSFNNLPTEQVVRDISSALAGGSGTLTKYGINVKVAAVEAEMMALGLDTSTEAAKRQSRTMAILSIAQRDSSDAMGDFIRTSEGFANQMETAKSIIEDFSAGVGKELLPHVTAVVKAFTDWAKEGDNLQVVIDGTAKVILVMAQGTVIAAKGIAYFAVGVGQLASSLLILLTPLEKTLDVLIKFGLIDANPITKMKDATQAFTDVAYEGYLLADKAADGLATSIKNIGTTSTESVEPVKQLAIATTDLAAASLASTVSLDELNKVFEEGVAIAAAADEAKQKFEESLKTEQAAVIESGNAIDTKTESIKQLSTATAVQIPLQSEFTAEVEKTTEAVIKNTTHTISMSNGYDKTTESIKAAAAAMREMDKITQQVNSRDEGYIAGRDSTVNYSRSGSKSRRGTEAAREREFLEEFLAAGGKLEDFYAAEDYTTNIYNFNQNVSRSDVENIVANANRNEERA